MNTFIPRPEHPNPQWERKNWKTLNGTWQFEIDNGISGKDRKLHEAAVLSSEIIVPFCPESPLSGVNNKEFMSCVWYKRAVSFTEQELAGNRVILHFGAADFETDVWVNGKSVGLPHVGGYTSFEYDITKQLSVGENVITVCCRDDVRSPRQGTGKQSQRFYSHECYYTRTTGIWQSVWYEIVPESYVKYARILPDLENLSVMIDAELCGRGDFSAEVFY